MNPCFWNSTGAVSTTWSTVTLTPAPAASTLTVPLLSAVPGLNFDFATFSFQVPTSEFLDWAKAVPLRAPTNATVTAATRGTCHILACANSRLGDVRIPHLL